MIKFSKRSDGKVTLEFNGNSMSAEPVEMCFFVFGIKFAIKNKMADSDIKNIYEKLGNVLEDFPKKGD